MPAIVIEDAGLNYTSPQQHFTSYNYPAFSPPSARNLVSLGGGGNNQNVGQPNLYEDGRSIFDGFDDIQEELYGSPLAFDASENGLWNGRFVPPPPRPPFMDDLVTDGVTTCDLCSWAMPTKSTFIFEGTIGEFLHKKIFI